MTEAAYSALCLRPSFFRFQENATFAKRGDDGLEHLKSYLALPSPSSPKGIPLTNGSTRERSISPGEG